MSGNGSIEEPGRSILILGYTRVCKLKGTSHMDAEVIMEVGPVGSTWRTGKPPTWGSDRAKLELS